jgi:hypothetical protein
MILSWQPFRLRFLREVSNPRKQFGANVTSFPLNFSVFNLSVTKALSGRNLIWIQFYFETFFSVEIVGEVVIRRQTDVAPDRLGRLQVRVRRKKVRDVSDF